jgi:hypothetical protein
MSLSTQGVVVHTDHLKHHPPALGLDQEHVVVAVALDEVARGGPSGGHRPQPFVGPRTATPSELTLGREAAPVAGGNWIADLWLRRFADPVGAAAAIAAR